MGFKAWLAKNVSNPSQYADSYAAGVLELAAYLAAAFVVFSGEQAADGGPKPNVVFGNTFEMQLSGFRVFTNDPFALLQPSASEAMKSPLYAPAYRASVAFVCLYSENTSIGRMKPENAERFSNTLYSSVAVRCAGHYGFPAEPRDTFMIIQEVIQDFRSNKVLNDQSFGEGDALGKVLNHLSMSLDKRTSYAFVVGSNKQPAGCAAHYVKVLTEITDNIKRCAQDLRW
jgi:hypothetical protein